MIKYYESVKKARKFLEMLHSRGWLRIFGWSIAGGGLLALIGYWWMPLPADVLAVEGRLSRTITDRHGIVLRETLAAEGGRTSWLRYDEIPAPVIQAVLEAEDHRFLAHPGVDVIAMGRALWQNLRAGRIVSGASTITQQLVKNRFGYPRTIIGKMREMWTALRLECTVSKPEILAQYLNRVSFANQAVGIAAAADLYFRKPVQHLSLAESVFLAGLVQAPSRLNPYRHFDRARQRQQHLLERMYRRGAIDATSYRIAQQEDIRLTPKQVNFRAPHFCTMLLADAEPASQTELRTTLDYYLQANVEEIVATRIDELSAYHVTNAAVVVMDNERGDILAWVGSKDFFDDTIAGQVDGVLALRQPGSALKPFTYQLALERGYTPATLIPDIKDYPAAPRSFQPENYDRSFHGPVRVRQALACSYNIPAVRVLEDLGVEALYHRLQALGLTSLRELPSFYGPGLTLGNGEVTLLELTRAYSTLARRGRPARERVLLSEAATPSESTPPGFDPQVIYLLTHMLADRQAAVPAFGEDTPLMLPFPTAVKTGTSKDYRDNWTVGFTREYTVGVWVGNFDGTPMRRVSGISGAAPIYHDILLHLYRYHDPPPLLADPPEGIVHRRICPLSGQLVGQHCPHAIEELFLAGTEPTETCPMHRAYWVDARSGLLTQPDAPHAVQKVFIHFPPLYQTWAHEMGYPTPPTRYATDESAAADASPAIEIVHPNDGDVYALDPVLRREYQTLQLSAVVPPALNEIVWYVDDEPWEAVKAPFQSAWPLAPGDHRIAARGRLDGEVLYSQEITVHVVP